MEDHIKKHREQISRNISNSYSSLEKGEKDTLQKGGVLGDFNLPNVHDEFEKGGKRAQIGEVRMWGKDKWVKHADGWVGMNGKGKHILERPGGKREDASEDHITHHKTHIDRLEREGEVHQKSSEKKVGDIELLGTQGKGNNMVAFFKKDGKIFRDPFYQDDGKPSLNGAKLQEVAGDQIPEKYREETKDAHEKRGFDESKGDVDVTGQSEKIPQEKEKVEREKPVILKYKDYMNNSFILHITSGTAVLTSENANTSSSLSNLAYNVPSSVANGTKAQGDYVRRVIKEASEKGKGDKDKVIAYIAKKLNMNSSKLS